jgi:NAD(P)-dependent dehydrogenase (short-subunit alcohol dehydrogenase family)
MGALQNKVIVITGGTSGIGQVAAQQLAAMGARIVLVARDARREHLTLGTLRGKGHSAYLANLALMREVKRVAAQIAAAEPHIDVLINNAGSMFAVRQVTDEGLERTFSTNHMAYFLMTHGLRGSLTGGSRVVSTASDVHRGVTLDFDDLQSERNYDGFSVYGKSKLCNVLFTLGLARRLEGTGITANCLHPGVVATRFASDGGDPSVASFLSSGITPEEGAKTIIYLASSPEVAGFTGKYFYQSQAADPSREAQDAASVERLWQESARLAGVPD